MIDNQAFDRYKVNQWKLSLLPNFFVLLGTACLSVLVFWFFQPIPTSTINSSELATFGTSSIVLVSISTSQSTQSPSIISELTANQTQLDLNQILASQSVENSTYYLLKGCENVSKNQACSLIQNNKVTGINILITANLFGLNEISSFEGQKFGFAAKQDQQTRINFVIYNNNSSSYNLISFDAETKSVILNQKIDPQDVRYTDYLR